MRSAFSQKEPLAKGALVANNSSCSCVGIDFVTTAAIKTVYHVPRLYRASRIAAVPKALRDFPGMDTGGSDDEEEERRTLESRTAEEQVLLSASRKSHAQL